MRSFAISSALFASAFAAGGTDYTQMGANWGETYPLCANGAEQSPIDLTVGGASSNEMMQINGYGYANDGDVDRAKLVDSVYVGYTGGEFVKKFADGSKSVFTPLQYHFHAPSEHTWDGKNYDLEVHFVHKYAGTSAKLGAVIGVAFDRAAGGNFENGFIQELIDNSQASSSRREDINTAAFLESVDMSEYWEYPGSLTTPPCSEGIKWTVIKEVQPISEEQLKWFTDKWAGKQDFAKGMGNNRVVQPLNSRTLYYSGATAGFTASLATVALALSALSFA